MAASGGTGRCRRPIVRPWGALESCVPCSAEVEQLASDLGAELRWVTPPEVTRSADLWGGTLPSGDED
jgi:hypothetical protein